MTSAFPVSSLFSVPPYLNNYFNLNASTHPVTTRRCNDIHILKENLEVAKRLFYFTGASAYLFLSDQRNPSLTSQGKLKIFFLISYNKFFICFNSIYFLYISPSHFSWFLPFNRLFVIFPKYFNNRTPFDNSVYNTDRVIFFNHHPVSSVR